MMTRVKLALAALTYAELAFAAVFVIGVLAILILASKCAPKDDDWI